MRTFTVAALAVAAMAAGQQGVRPTTDVTVDVKRERAERAGGAPASLLRGADGPFDESGDIPGCVYGDSFDSYVGVDGYGLPAFNFDGGAWAVIEDAWAGVVNNDAAQSRPPAYVGPAGGPDPMGVRGGMLSLQRGSYGDEAVELGLGDPAYSSTTDLYFGSFSQPMFVTVDIYKPSHETFQWWDPASGFEGLVLARMLFGGYYESGTLRSLADRFGDAGINEGVIFLIAIETFLSQFFTTPHAVPEGGWFTVGVLVSQDDYTLWIRDDATLADDLNTGDGPDYKTPVRDSGAFAGQRMFEEFGFGLEEGWVQIFPGIEDDPATADVIEGDGFAVSETGIAAIQLMDTNGNAVGVSRAARSVDDPYRLLVGSDPTQAQLPGYEVEDWWADNLCVRGERFIPCPGDIDGDRTVGASDLGALLAAWGDPAGDPAADLDGDGEVGPTDLGILIAAWGACP